MRVSSSSSFVSRKLESDRVAVEKNKKDGEAYLAANKAKPGVVTLPDGLQYKVIKEGTGPVPKATDTVTTHYRGTLIDGTVFDSSYDRKKPESFPVNGVIRGWTEALQKMKVGSKWQLTIPSELAYGQNPPQGSPITPGAVLLFEIELLGIGPAAPRLRRSRPTLTKQETEPTRPDPGCRAHFSSERGLNEETHPQMTQICADGRRGENGEFFLRTSLPAAFETRTISCLSSAAIGVICGCVSSFHSLTRFRPAPAGPGRSRSSSLR